MSDTSTTPIPLSERIRPNSEAAPWVIEAVQKLERENAALREAISGRTVSCGQCNTLATENQAMREAIREAHNAIKASPYPDQQALAKLKPFTTP
jgi:hypothetical protein